MLFVLEIQDFEVENKKLHSIIFEKENVIIENIRALNERDMQIAHLQEMIVLLKHAKFGPKSEKLKNLAQVNLFNEGEELSSKEVVIDDLVEDGPAKGRGQPKRRVLPENLPREEVVIELGSEDRQCPCGCTMQEIGAEVSEKLDVIPAQFKVIRTIRKKYACKACEMGIKAAPVPEQILPKSIATAGLAAYILISKFCDHLPLYRLEGIFERYGVELSRTSMARWMVLVGEQLLPLTNFLREELLNGDYIHCDETRVQVLDEKGKTAQSLSYMWVQSRAGPDPIVLFEYDPSRGGDVPIKLLEGFRGYLQVDGYAGYNAFCKQDGVIRLGCFAHARRKFFEATKASKRPGLANQGLKFIEKLYKVESLAEKMTTEERHALRQAQSLALTVEFKKWLDEQGPRVPPKSALGKAMSYTLEQWPHLVRYLERGDLRMDNNLVENSIRPFALGRKNWLFSQSVEGAQASATIYSLIETAKANGLNPFLYIRAVLERIPHAKTAEDFEALLPTRIKLN